MIYIKYYIFFLKKKAQNKATLYKNIRDPLPDK